MRPAIMLALALAIASPVSWSAPLDASGQPQEAADASFARGTPLPSWTQPLAVAPATQRDDAYVMRLGETQVMVGKTPEILVHQEIQVNDRATLSSIGQYRIHFVPAWQKLALHRVAIQRGDRIIEHTATVDVRLLDREESLDSGIYGGARFAQLLLDDVRVGDTLIIVYSLGGANPVFGERWSDHFSWDKPYPIELRRLVVMHPQDRRIQWRQVGDYRTAKVTPVVDRVGSLVRMQFEGRAIDAVELEPSMPGDYLALRMLQFTEYRDWKEVATWAAGLFPRVQPGGELAELAGQFRKLEGKERQASAALRWVQDEIRYFSVSLGENSHRPQPPAVVLKRRFGDCKDKSYLLASLLSELGIRAEPVLVNASAPEVPGKVLASPGWFDHAIVRVELDGRIFYVDPTRSGERASIPDLPVAVPKARGLVVNPATAALTALPDDDSTYPQVEYIQKLAVKDLDGDATLEARQVYRGRYAASARAVLGGSSASELKKFALERVEKTYPGIRLEGTPELRDSEDGTSIEVVSRFAVPKPVRLEDGYYGVNIDSQILDGTLGIPDKLVRNFPFALPRGRYRGRFWMHIEWPASVRFGSNAYDETLDNPYFYARSEYARMGRQLDYQYDYRLKSAVVPAAAMPGLHGQAKKLDKQVVTSLRVGEGALSEHTGDYSLRQLEFLSAMTQAREVTRLLAKKNMVLDADDVNGFCDAVRMLDAAGRAVPDAPALVDKATHLLGKAGGVPGAQRCVARLRFAQGKLDKALPAFEADLPEPADETWREYTWSRAAYNGAGAVRAAEERRAALEKDGRHDATAAIDAMALHQLARKPVPASLAAFTRSQDGTWPRPILMMQAGLITPAELLRQAEAYEADGRAVAVNDAMVFIGEYWLARGERAKALDAFNWYPRNGLPSTFEHKLAMAELNRLQLGDADYQAGLAEQSAARPDVARAAAKYAAAARRGLPAAQYRLGLLRYDAKAYGEALPWLEKAAASGSGDALNLMATMYEQGQGVAVDAGRATSLLRQAAGPHGHIEASARLGDRYRDGTGGLSRDPALALQHYLAAAELGNPRAQDVVAQAYAEGTGVTRNDRLAYLWAELASAAGSASGTARLGLLLADGRGTGQDLPRAIRLWRAAAKDGSTEAQVHLGDAYVKGRGVKRDLAQAKAWFAKASASGNHYARLAHGVLTMESGPPADEVARVLDDLDRLAKDGMSDASFEIARLYREGKGVGKDMAKAVDHYKAAAAHGNDNALLALAFIYHFGEGGIKKDGVEAAKWYRLSAERRNWVAINNLADMYEKGFGVGQDYPTAIRMYRDAAHLGSSVALYSLGTLYEHGRGLKKDAYMAYVFYAMAAHGGLEEGYAAIGRMARQLTREQLAAAVTIASGWQRDAAFPDEPAPAGGGVERAK